MRPYTFKGYSKIDFHVQVKCHMYSKGSVRQFVLRYEQSGKEPVYLTQLEQLMDSFHFFLLQQDLSEMKEDFIVLSVMAEVDYGDPSRPAWFTTIQFTIELDPLKRFGYSLDGKDIEKNNDFSKQRKKQLFDYLIEKFTDSDAIDYQMKQSYGNAHLRIVNEEEEDYETFDPDILFSQEYTVNWEVPVKWLSIAYTK